MLGEPGYFWVDPVRGSSELSAKLHQNTGELARVVMVPEWTKGKDLKETGYYWCRVEEGDPSPTVVKIESGLLMREFLCDDTTEVAGAYAEWEFRSVL